MNADRRSAPADPLTRLDESQRAQLASARRAARWVGVVLPLALTAVATALTAAWIPRMPDPSAIHWGPSFEPDGFGPPWTNAVMALVLGLCLTALSALQWLQRWQTKQRGGAVWSSMYRFLPAIVFGTVLFVQVIAVGTAWVQLDVVDARETGSIAGVMLGGFVLWVAATVLAFLAQPRLRIDAPGSEPARPTPLAPNERAVWVGEARPSRAVFWVMGVVILLMLGAVVLVFAVPGAEIAGWIMVGTLLLVLALMATSLYFRARIDSRGLEVRSAVGWPVFRLRADDVVSVEVAQIAPFAEYGGWGMRWTPDRFGVVMRTGEGIVATRRNGRLFAVTVDDAEAGAGLLAAVARNAERNEGDHE